MGSEHRSLLTALLQPNTFFILFSLLLGILIAVFVLSSSYIKCVVKRFIRIQLRKRVIDPTSRGSDTGTFVSYYRTYLCHLQKINNELLATILYNNHSCAFFVDRSISFLTSSSSSSSRQGEYASIDEFREKVPLTNYDDYRNYIDRMIQNGEKNLLSSEKIIYYATSSGTTGKTKFLPFSKSMLTNVIALMRVGSSLISTALSPKHLSPEQRAFQLNAAKKANTFPKSKDGTPVGPGSQFASAVSSFRGYRFMMSTCNVLSFDLIEEMPDHETSTFVQLVFALAIPDLSSYSVMFASAFTHTVKVIEKYFEEISLCISFADFNYSSIVRDNICDSKLIVKLNLALNDVTLEYGGFTYRLERAEHIRKECLRQDISGILHRLWPTMIFASTTTGGSFTMYNKRNQFYCGEKLPLINMLIYVSSEGIFGTLASIHTAEYFLSPTAAFFEFIREEDIHQAQPKTLLISEIEPGNRYELVITTVVGLVRYRMGDVINCTRFLTRADDLVPLPSELVEIPRIPLISIAYRIGSLLNVFGEKTSEQHLLDALEQAVNQWRHQGLPVGICDFTTFQKLDVFPPRYVIFLELISESEYQIDDQQLQVLQNSADSEVDRQLCITGIKYKNFRDEGKLAPLTCILVRSGTFSIFLNEKLVTQSVSGLQIKPHRLLKNEQHIQFFYDNQIANFSPSSHID